MSKDRRLGRGLAALLSDPAEESAPLPRVHDPEAADAAPTSSSDDASTRPSAADEPQTHTDLLLSVDEILENPFQPRRDFGKEEIASLAASLGTHDMLQPVLVRRHAGGWQLISGERRLRAAVHAGWTHIPARVKEADDRLVAELAIVENLQRKDLNPIEKALSFQRYLTEHRCTQDELGQRLKIDRSTIANLVRLLELPEEVRRSLQAGEISAGHARAILPLGTEQEQIEFCQRIKTEGLSVRATEGLIQEILAADTSRTLPLRPGRKRQAQTRTSQVLAMEQDLRRALGTKIDIHPTAKGSGRIVIHFKNPDEFDRLRHYLTDDSLPSATAPQRATQ